MQTSLWTLRTVFHYLPTVLGLLLRPLILPPTVSTPFFNPLAVLLALPRPLLNHQKCWPSNVTIERRGIVQWVASVFLRELQLFFTQTVAFRLLLLLLLQVCQCACVCVVIWFDYSWKQEKGEREEGKFESSLVETRRVCDVVATATVCLSWWIIWRCKQPACWL